MEFLMILLVILLILGAFVIYKIKTQPDDEEEEEEKEEISQQERMAKLAACYQRKYLLTHHEWSFYKELKPVADKLGYTVLAKIRMADLVEAVANNNSDYYKGFAKVKAKHVDFALARPDNLYIELLIELDDNSHTEGNERDAFVEAVYASVGYKLLRVRGGEYLEDKITAALDSKVIGVEST